MRGEMIDRSFLNLSPDVIDICVNDTKATASQGARASPPPFFLL